MRIASACLIFLIISEPVFVFARIPHLKIFSTGKPWLTPDESEFQAAQENERPGQTANDYEAAETASAELKPDNVNDLFYSQELPTKSSTAVSRDWDGLDNPFANIPPGGMEGNVSQAFVEEISKLKFETFWDESGLVYIPFGEILVTIEETSFIATTVYTVKGILLNEYELTVAQKRNCLQSNALSGGFAFDATLGRLVYKCRTVFKPDYREFSVLIGDAVLSSRNLISQLNQETSQSNPLR